MYCVHCHVACCLVAACTLSELGGGRRRLHSARRAGNRSPASARSPAPQWRDTLTRATHMNPLSPQPLSIHPAVYAWPVPDRSPLSAHQYHSWPASACLRSFITHYVHASCDTTKVHAVSCAASTSAHRRQSASECVSLS